jgi:acetyltransferase-like isoleucine patch superfamily enzyme
MGYKLLWRKQIEFGSSVTLGKWSTIHIESAAARLHVGNNVEFRKFCSVLVGGRGLLRIGNNVFFNNYCSVNCLEAVEIGDDTIIGEGVRIYDHNHLFDRSDVVIRHQGFKYGPIKIGANCWIGSNTVVLQNVSVGNNVVIGANNLIVKSIPDYTVVKAGTAQIIEQRRL